MCVVDSRKSFYGVLGLIAVAAVLGAFAPGAYAVTPLSASLTMTSEPGDYIGAGQSYSYDTSAGDTIGSTSNGQVVNASVFFAANGDWWFLDFAAPQGQTLAVGTYSGATRYPFNAPSEPGLSVSGNGRGCNTLTGSFSVNEVTFGPNGYLETFDVDFEQHCEGSIAALRGHLHIVNPPAPQPLTLALGLNETGSYGRNAGTATVGGTVTCDQPASVFVSGTLTQRVNRFSVARGHFERQVACSGTTPWQATLSSDNTVPFGAGVAALSATANAYDPAYGQQVTDSKSATVRLGR